VDLRADGGGGRAAVRGELAAQPVGHGNELVADVPGLCLPVPERGISEPPATVGGVMTAPAVSMSVRSDVVDLVTAMRDDGLRSMLIVDGTRLVGMVTRHDLVRTLTRDEVDVERDVRHQLEIYGGLGRWTVEVRGGAVTIPTPWTTRPTGTSPPSSPRPCAG
jgi:hypothetical protein